MKKLNIKTLIIFIVSLYFINIVQAGYYNFKDINEDISSTYFTASMCASHGDGSLNAYATSNIGIPKKENNYRGDVMIDLNWDGKITWYDFQEKNGYGKNINTNGLYKIIRNGKIRCAQYDGWTGGWASDIIPGTHIVGIRIVEKKFAYKAKMVKKEYSSITIERRIQGSNIWNSLYAFPAGSNYMDVYTYFNNKNLLNRIDWGEKGTGTNKSHRFSFFDPKKNPNRYEFRIIENLTNGGKIEGYYQYGMMFEIFNRAGIGYIEGGVYDRSVSTIIPSASWSSDGIIELVSSSLGGSGIKSYKIEVKKNNNSIWKTVLTKEYPFGEQLANGYVYKVVVKNIYNSFKLTGDGIYDIRVTLYDNANNKSSFNHKKILKLDTVSPLAKVTYSLIDNSPYILGSIAKQSVVVKITCEDTGSGCDMKAITNWTVVGDTYTRVFTSSQAKKSIIISDSAGNTTTVAYGGIQLDITLVPPKVIKSGVAITGNVASQSNITNNDVRVLGKFIKSRFRKDIQKKIYTIIRNISPKITGNTTLNSIDVNPNIWNNIGIMANSIVGNKVLYFGDVGGANIKLSGASNIEGNKTLLVEGGNIYITGNILNPDNNGILGLIALEKNGQGGNIYIDPNVTDINAIIYADRSLISYNGITLNGDTATSSDLANQLYIKGSIFSENTIGGSKSIPVICPYYVSSSNCNTSQKAQEYDISYLRRYFIYDSNVNGSIEYDGSDLPANGGISSIGGGNNTFRKYPVIIDYNSKIQQNPPPFFD